MPYDPFEDLYTAEPKLLSIDCFPTFFPYPAPPDYDLIMAANTQYQRVPQEVRPSIDSSVGDEDVLHLAALANDPEAWSPNKEHNFECNPTTILRLFSIIVFIPSFVLLIVGHRQVSIAATVFIGITIARNVLVLLHHIFSKHLRLRLEFRNRSPRHQRNVIKCPEWARHGRLHLLIDLILLIALLITTILAITNRPWRYNWYFNENTPCVTAGCILAFIGMVLYVFAVPDLGKPSNISITGGISFDYSGKKRVGQPERPQVYRDVEATGGLGVTSRKTGADSPVML